jgi:hypothetical protein
MAADLVGGAAALWSPNHARYPIVSTGFDDVLKGAGEGHLACERGFDLLYSGARHRYLR